MAFEFTGRLVATMAMNVENCSKCTRSHTFKSNTNAIDTVKILFVWHIANPIGCNVLHSLAMFLFINILEA